MHDKKYANLTIKDGFAIYEKFCIFMLSFFWTFIHFVESYQVLKIKFSYQSNKVINFFKFNKKNREIFLSQLNTTREVSQINDILSLLVPRFVKDLLLQGIYLFFFPSHKILFEIYPGIYTLSEEQGEVSILFCDFCHFDEIIASENTNIVKILDSLFRNFDLFCLENSVQKIEVIYYLLDILRFFKNFSFLF